MITNLDMCRGWLGKMARVLGQTLQVNALTPPVLKDVTMTVPQPIEWNGQPAVAIDIHIVDWEWEGYQLHMVLIPTGSTVPQQPLKTLAAVEEQIRKGKADE